MLLSDMCRGDHGLGLIAFSLEGWFTNRLQGSSKHLAHADTVR